MTNFTQEQIDFIFEKQKDLLFLLGVVTTVLIEMGDSIPQEQRAGVKWIMEALDNTIYQKKPLPPFPER